MTTEQRTTYQSMRLIRKHMNQEGSDRHELGLELERLRRSLGGMQYAPTPHDIVHKPVFEYRQRRVTLEQFPKCPECKRMLHYSVIGEVCYSCGRAR